MLLQNPTTAVMMMDIMRNAMRDNRPEIIPSSFFDLVSPSVSVYKEVQTQMTRDRIADEESVAHY